MLHIISITEIKFRRLTRQVLGMQTTQEEQPTVEETIDLVREMQAIRPQTPPAEPEADYGQYSQGHLGGALVSTVRVIVEGVWSVQTVRVTLSTGSQGYGQYRQGHRGASLVSTDRVMVSTDSQGYGQYISTDRVMVSTDSQGYGQYRQGHHGEVWSVQTGTSWWEFGQYRQGHHEEVWSAPQVSHQVEQVGRLQNNASSK